MKATGTVLLGFCRWSGGAGGVGRALLRLPEEGMSRGRAGRRGDAGRIPQHLSGTSTSIDIDVTTLELMAAAWSSLLIVFVFG